MDATALFKLSYGLYVISSLDGERVNAQVANTVFQISDNPVRIGVSLNRNNLTNEFVKKSGLLTINVLERDVPFPTIGRFGFQSGRTVDKFADFPYEKSINGCPVLTDGIAAEIACRVVDQLEVETHTLFICEVLDAKKNEKEPMTYAHYHERKRSGGAVVQPASASQPAEVKAEGKGKKYQCLICGHIYDEEKEGVKFADLPEDWTCPICHVNKNMFREIN